MRPSRRQALLAAPAAVAGGIVARGALDHGEWFHRAATVVARVTSYDANLTATFLAGLAELGFDRDRVRGRSVLLKPNLVEPAAEAPHATTHPLFVRAAAEAFRRLDAREVLVAEGPGHARDTRLVLEESGLAAALLADRLPFIDLNVDELYAARNALGATPLAALHLPRTLRRAEIIVSLPKMKTHHWMGVTLAMKNLFGVMPGAYYGWPKTILHEVGIAAAIADITATVRPHLALVDGVVGMEGDGPIMGTPRAAGVVVMGTNLVAVDATAARLMGFDPLRLPYLRGVGGRLGPIAEAHIEQRGERLAPLVTRFALPPHPHYQQFRGG
jgi:uncharacterized protein (DUF362 family)